MSPPITPAATTRAATTPAATTRAATTPAATTPAATTPAATTPAATTPAATVRAKMTTKWNAFSSLSKLNWTGVACSKNRINLAACAYDDYIYYSNNSGNTWTKTPSEKRNWTAITSAVHATTLVACAHADYIYASYDVGKTWIPLTGSGTRNWTSIDASSDGKILVASVNHGYFYISKDAGNTWSQMTMLGKNNWTGITCSYNGNVIALCEYDGYIYISNDGGNAWAVIQSLGQKKWTDISVSADGKSFAACVENDFIYISNDGGNKWAHDESSGQQKWTGISSSSDGSKLIACVENENVYMNPKKLLVPYNKDEAKDKSTIDYVCYIHESITNNVQYIPSYVSTSIENQQIYDEMIHYDYKDVNDYLMSEIKKFHDTFSEDPTTLDEYEKTMIQRYTDLLYMQITFKQIMIKTSVVYLGTDAEDFLENTIELEKIKNEVDSKLYFLSESNSGDQKTSLDSTIYATVLGTIVLICLVYIVFSNVYPSV